MHILALDTSCDDTSASVLKDGSAILSNIVSNQNEIHAKYSGIVPELASRKHIEMIIPVVQEALDTAKLTLKDIDVVAVTYAPGLIGSLLVSVCFAKSIAYALQKPLVAVNHLAGHIYSVFLEHHDIEFPYLCLVASGGHTSLYLVRDFYSYQELGRTRDDAVGEAYDKVAKMLGLSYPGGPIIDKLASQGNKDAFDFPRGYVHNSFDFSFSGIKNAVRLKIAELKELSLSTKQDIGASFQNAVTDVLVRKVHKAVIHTGIKSIAVAGGVAANSNLRAKMQELASDKGYKLYLPSLKFCTDNAAMIAFVGYHLAKAQKYSDLTLNASSTVVS